MTKKELIENWCGDNLYPVFRLFMFEPNTPDTWKLLHTALSAVLEFSKETGFIDAYQIQADQDSVIVDGKLAGALYNSDDSVKAGEYHTRLYLETGKEFFEVKLDVSSPMGLSFTVEILNNVPGWN